MVLDDCSILENRAKVEQYHTTAGCPVCAERILAHDVTEVLDVCVGVVRPLLKASGGVNHHANLQLVNVEHKQSRRALLARARQPQKRGEVEQPKHFATAHRNAKDVRRQTRDRRHLRQLRNLGDKLRRDRTRDPGNLKPQHIILALTDIITPIKVVSRAIVHPL